MAYTIRARDDLGSNGFEAREHLTRREMLMWLDQHEDEGTFEVIDESDGRPACGYETEMSGGAFGCDCARPICGTQRMEGLMFHMHRSHRIQPLPTFEAVVAAIVSYSELDVGYSCGTLVFLNDSLTNFTDRFWVWAVIRNGRQIESITTNPTNPPDDFCDELARDFAAMDEGRDPGIDMGPVVLKAQIEGEAT